jgi:hypothetical protein
MGYPVKPLGFSTSRLRLGRLTTDAYAQNNWHPLEWEEIVVEENWGGTVTTLPATVIDIYEPGKYMVLMGVARRSSAGGTKDTTFRFVYDESVTDPFSGCKYTMLGGNIMSPFYGTLDPYVFLAPGTVKVEYKCSQSHDIIADDESYIDIIRVSN